MVCPEVPARSPAFGIPPRERARRRRPRIHGHQRGRDAPMAFLRRHHLATRHHAPILRSASQPIRRLGCYRHHPDGVRQPPQTAPLLDNRRGADGDCRCQTLPHRAFQQRRHRPYRLLHHRRRAAASGRLVRARSAQSGGKRRGQSIAQSPKEKVV